MKIVRIEMGVDIVKAAGIACAVASENRETHAFEFNGKVLYALPDDQPSAVVDRFDRLNGNGSAEIAKLRKTAEEYGTVTKTLESLINGGLMPEGWTVSAGLGKLVYDTVIEYRKQVRELEHANTRQEFVVDELLERLARKSESEKASLPF